MHQPDERTAPAEIPSQDAGAEAKSIPAEGQLAVNAAVEAEPTAVLAEDATAVPTAQSSPATPPARPVKVLVVDDELAQLTAAHMREFAADFLAELGDINSATTQVVWDIVCAEVAGKTPYAAVSPAEVAAFIASDDFVPVVLSAAMRQAAMPLPGLLMAFHEHADGVADLRKLIESAYPAPAFQVTFQATRPAPPSSLRSYDLVILDLVLARSADAVDELVKYLALLARDDAPLPCLIVLSSREEMVDNRPRFSSLSQISAAGLLLLEKREVRKAAFRVVGLQLSYEQLNRQRDVAQYTRIFVRAWINGLEAAQEAASQTLWNLDAAAMQEIHLSASSDDDPYDAHLNELVAREYLWHVEGVEAVATAVDALDAAFQLHLKSDGRKLTIAERFVAPYADPKPERNLVSHYNWAGFRPIGSLAATSAETLASKFNRIVPFGAVLAPEPLAVGAHCWVHITQQCDLNSAVRVSTAGALPDGSVSATFATATAMPVSDGSIPAHDTRDLVARGLRIDGQEFDLKLVQGRTISLPIKKIIRLVRARRQRVVGRLRHDIATQFLNATTNHMSRPAQLKATRVQMRPARLYLWGTGYNGNQPVGYVGIDGTIKTLQVGFNDKQCYLADEASLSVALWLAEEARSKLGKTVDASKLYNQVRGGMVSNGSVVSVINLIIVNGPFADIDGYFGGNLPSKPSLILFAEQPA